MSSRRWADQRGVTMVELLVAAVVGAVVLLGMFSLYRATTTSFNQSSSRAYLQRQGTLALQEIARQAQRSSTPDPLVACPAIAPMLKLTVIDTIPTNTTLLPAAEIGTYCYYAASAANPLTACISSTPFCTLWERFIQKSNGSIRSRDLVFGATGLVRQTGKTRVSLLFQTSPADPRCPTGVPIGQPCLSLGLTTTADVAFGITDGLNGISFKASLKQRNS